MVRTRRRVAYLAAPAFVYLGLFAAVAALAAHPAPIVWIGLGAAAAVSAALTAAAILLVPRAR